MNKLPIWRRYTRLHGVNPRADVDDEFAFHLSERVEALVAQGRSPDEARTEALAKFGNLEFARRTCATIGERRTLRERVASYAASWGQDTRYAIRVFGRSPAFAAAVVLTAALGIGANAALFSVLNALLLRPLPVSHPEELVRVYTSDASARNGGTLFGASSYPDYAAMRAAPSFRGLVAYAPAAASIRRGTLATRANGRFVSENFFTVLGVRPALGRLLAPSDAESREIPAVVLDHRFWRVAFNSDSSIVGSVVGLNGKSAVVVGIVSNEFTGLDPSAADVYLPITAQRHLSPGFDFVGDRGARFISVLGRIAPGVTEARVAEDLALIMRRLGSEYPETNRDRIVTVRRATSLIDTNREGPPVAPVTTLLFAVTGVVLLIAVVNVAALLLARTLSRRRELSVRVSLGASRWRVTRQLITESLVLAMAAEIAALAAVAVLPYVARAMGVPDSVRFGLDARVLLFTSVITLAATLGFTLVPAVRGTRSDIYAGLREAESSARPSRARAQRSLVVVQVALSVVLLITAGLLIQSLQRQRAVQPGFDTEHVLAAEFETITGSQTPEQERAFVRTTLERARALPGVVAASVASNPPLTGDGMRTTISVPGYVPGKNERVEPMFLMAGTDYFATLGIRLVRGEELRSTGSDTLPHVVVNETMARRYWPNRDAVGSTIRLWGGPARVIGIMADVRMLSLTEPPTPRFVLQSRQRGGSVILLRTHGDPAELIPTVQQLLGTSHPDFVARRVRTMEEIVGASLMTAKALVAVIGLLGALALTLAVCGLYGVVNYLATLRSREFAVRMALGANGHDVVAMVLRSGLRLAAIGGVIGLVLGLASSAMMRGFVFSISVVELPTLALATLLMAVVAVAACAIPALRTTRVSPASALRAD
jgi:predicted permease